MNILLYAAHLLTVMVMDMSWLISYNIGIAIDIVMPVPWGVTVPVGRGRGRISDYILRFWKFVILWLVYGQFRVSLGLV